MTSQPTKSYFGDKYLFFKHQDMVEDLKIKPEWTSSVKVASANEGCPYLKALRAVENVSSFVKTVTGQYF